MSVETKIKNLLNYITGSAGGWPTNTNIGILAGVDYIKEETTDNIYFNEMNTACGIYGSYNEQKCHLIKFQTMQMKKVVQQLTYMDTPPVQKQIHQHYNNQ